MRPELLERIPFRNEMALQRAAGVTRLFSFNGDALKVPEYLATMKEKQLSIFTSDDQLYKASSEKSSRPSLPQLSAKKNL